MDSIQSLTSSKVLRLPPLAVVLEPGITRVRFRFCRGLGGLCFAGEHARDRIGQEHPARGTHRRLRSTGQKATRRASWHRQRCRSGASWHGATAEQPRQESGALTCAAGLSQFGFQLPDPGRRGIQRLLLHHDRLRHVMGRAGLTGDGVTDEAFGLGVTVGHLALDL